jgi:cell division protein FtsW
MTCLALGMVISVSAKRDIQIKEEQEENPLDILSEAI